MSILSGRRRPRWLSALLFLIAFVVLNVVTSAMEPWALRHVLPDNLASLARVEWYLTGTRRADVLFMGSSRALFGFDPAVVESEIRRLDGADIHALNIGNSGTDVHASYLILKNLIPDESKPRVIVYGLSEYELNSSLDANTQNLPYYSRLLQLDDYSQITNELGAKADFILSQVFPIYRDRQLIRDAVTTQMTSPVGATANTAPENGFFAAPVLTRASLLAWKVALTYQYRPLPGFAYSGPRLDWMNAFLDLARSRGIQVVLVNMPLTRLHRSSWTTPADEDRYLALVRSLARQHDVALLDLYRDPPHTFPASDYLDSQHLAPPGAAILSQIVAREYLADLLRAPAGGG